MDIKIGANGDLQLGVNQAGDIVAVLADNEALSEQGGNIAIHPAALSAALLKLLGGAAWAQSALAIVIPLAVSALPKV